LIQVGEVRQAMTKGLEEILEYVLNKKKNLSKYWILIYGKVENLGLLATKVVILPLRPQQLIGTVCYEVDNDKGTKELLWLLPLDLPMPKEFELTEPNEKIFNFAQGMPIVH
jgi:hypothetical protein